MEPDFWHQRWARGEIDFHQPQGNPLLVKWFHRLERRPGDRIFVPLCGKTPDIGWLMSQGHPVVGCELSETAVVQLFEELGLKPEVTGVSGHRRYAAAGLDVLVGDFFELSAAQIGPVKAVYDRAALVAMPAGRRARYAAQLIAVADAAPQLLISFCYEQGAMQGPPFSVDGEELTALYGRRYTLQLLESAPVGGGLKGLCPAEEQVWHLC